MDLRRSLGGLTLALASVLAGALGYASDRRSGRIEVVEHTRPDMVVVRGGSFIMGPSTADLAELRIACRRELGGSDYFCSEDFHGNFKLEARTVHIDAFAIDRYEVTVAAYRACVAAGYCDITPLAAGDERYLQKPGWPMVNVTWQDAVDYCIWLGKRLPTEAEWEKAARGTSGKTWPWGNHDRVDGSNHGKGESRAMQYTQGFVPQNSSRIRLGLGYAPDGSDGYLYAAPVGDLRWSEGPYGAYDMSGNVSEWVADYFSVEGYEGLSDVNPLRDVRPTGYRETRAIRGGSWYEPKFFGRTYYRHLGVPGERSGWLGFRCARSLD